jgi:HD-GYP domain-containing protein (c-di-GMP phosphodiesterase class II)
MFVEVEVTDLTIGMYLVEIVKPKGKFQLLEPSLIKKHKTIILLQNKGVEIVLIDPDKSQITQDKKNNKQPKKSFKEEFFEAKAVFDESKNIQKKLFHDAGNGSPLDLSAVKNITDESIDLIFNNSNALASVLNIRQKDEYLLEHSVAVSILVTMFSFYLKIDKEIIRKLSIGAFLHDVGKIKIPESILNKPGKLTDVEFEVMKTHASHSIEIIKKTPGIDPISLEVAALHHEQLSGKGYPNGVKEISLYGRLIAICDIFDALTSTRCYKKGMPQVNAFKILKSMAKTDHLDAGLVDKFILCMGVYPVGSIVQLESNRLAIVESNDSQNLLTPKVATFYRLGKKEFESRGKIDLSKNHVEKIVKCVHPDDFDLDMSKVFEFLEHQG